MANNNSVYTVRKRFLEFYRRQRFRLKNRHQKIKVAIKGVSEAKGLSLGFATLCVVDLFGVFPIIALPATLISCGKLKFKKCIHILYPKGL